MRIIIMVLAMVVAGQAWAKNIEGKDFPDSLLLNKKNLVLNGVGLRTKKKMGMTFKVYVAGLYVTAKSTDGKKLIDSPDKVLELIFMRSVDKEKLQGAWTEAFPKNCQADCDKSADQLKKFNDLMVDVKENNRLKVAFDKDGVTVTMDGEKESKSGRIDGAVFAKNMMAVFIGPQPPSEELKKGLLGL